ncbi:hypothetical protein [Eoetvoesiella caeni]|uniref:Uncharacterized protein n=1 Tax=Eoetvoesiella caeni TaxID=645616 RepID=A0A366H0D5_9BURK|nr:hypothetical protein [Eoetvoesiella caeni]MCI2811290.1 hypothetical protein [Eoetvoesiella caeni]NYT57244.1 hypothetical protein [Eoetvoesiella caeni]RBP33618.1 hypothetical protein DFR37_1269 [Eoetvoesiella caeni]
MSTSFDVLTVVLRLPQDPEQRKAVTAALAIGREFHGAQVTAASMEDEISVMDFIEEALSEEGSLSHVLDEARQKARELHRTLVPNENN